MYVLSAGDEADRPALRLLAAMRRAGIHARRSYKTTRNVGKLLGEASRSGATKAVILGKELHEGHVQLKDLVSGDQELVPLDGVVEMISASESAGE